MFIVAIYIIISFPLVVIHAINKHARKTTLEMTAHYYSKFRPMLVVGVGDSIMAGLGNIGLRVRRNPLSSRNLGVNGYTVKQVSNTLKQAIDYKPKYVVVMAGINDITNGFNIDSSVAAYEDMIALIKNAGISPVVTLVPLLRGNLSDEINQFNKAIAEAANKYDASIIDLNRTIAPNQVSRLPEYYSEDGHFSELAYAVWSHDLSRIIR